MKIGFIKKNFTPYGGAENYLNTLINSLKEEGYSIHIFSSMWKAAEGVTIHKVKSIKLNSALSILSFNHNVAAALKRIKPDCVLSFERTTSGDIYRAGDGCHKEWLKIRGSVAGKIKRLSFSLNPLHITLLGIEKRIFKKAKAIVANSNMIKKQIMEHYGVAEERIHVIYNGVNIKRFTPLQKRAWRTEIRKNYSIPENTPLIIFVGSGYERKGLKTLINAMNGLNKSLKLMVIGHGNNKKFMDIVNHHKLTNRIIFPGPQKEIEKFYSASDLFVLPTLYDPFSNAALEAMSSGLPVITTKNNGTAELIEEGKEGFVLNDMLSSSELSEKINMALKNGVSMGQMARIKAEKFSISNATSEFVKLIKHTKNKN